MEAGSLTSPAQSSTALNVYRKTIWWPEAIRTRSMEASQADYTSPITRPADKQLIYPYLWPSVTCKTHRHTWQISLERQGRRDRTRWPLPMPFKRPTWWITDQRHPEKMIRKSKIRLRTKSSGTSKSSTISSYKSKRPLSSTQCTHQRYPEERTQRDNSRPTSWLTKVRTPSKKMSRKSTVS